MERSEQVQQISERELKIIAKITTEILVEYQNQGNPLSLEQFYNLLVSERETIKDKDSILEDIESAFETIDLANEYQQELLASQEKGQSKLNWLKSTIKSIFNLNDAKEIGKIVKDVQSALAKVNNQHLNLIVEEELRLKQNTQILTSTESDETNEVTINQEVISENVEYTVSQGATLQETKSELFSDRDFHNGVVVKEKVEIATSVENYDRTIGTKEKSDEEHSYSNHVIFDHHHATTDEQVDVYTSMEEVPFEGIDRQVSTGKLLEELENNSLLSSIAFAQQVNSITSNSVTETANPLEITQNYFESDLDSSDTTLSKLSTLGLLVAKYEHLGVLEKVGATELAVMADSGLFMAKVMYKLAQGKIRHDQAIEKLSEKVVSGASAVLQKAAKLKSRLVGAKAGAMIGSVFGPVGTVVGAAGGYVAGKLAGNKISQGIKSGVKKVAIVAKKMVKKTVEVAKKVSNTVKNTAKKAGAFINNIFGW